jgi:TFIIF-interacting CTD phosphatase-like protein
MTLPFLAVAPNPYLRETLDKRPTLVIDIVEIFCHGTRKSKSHVFRPHTEHFLHEMSQYYEVVSFTCAYPNQIDKVIDILDPKKHIKQRLYRHHTIWVLIVLLSEIT